MIKNKHVPFISLEKLYYDTILLVKVNSCSGNNVLYIAFVYIHVPPPGSVFFNLYPCEIFWELESQISLYKSTGKVLALGDLNARADYLVHDALHNTSVSRNTVLYVNGSCYEQCVNPDVGYNEYIWYQIVKYV